MNDEFPWKMNAFYFEVMLENFLFLMYEHISIEIISLQGISYIIIPIEMLANNWRCKAIMF